MNWKELMDFIASNPQLFDQTVMVYDRTLGEYYPSDTIEFLDSDDVLDAGSTFMVIDT